MSGKQENPSGCANGSQESEIGVEATPEEQSDMTEDRDLRVELEIDRGGPCGMDRIDGNIIGVDVMLAAGQCRVDIDVKEENDQQGSTKQFTSNICEHCPGAVFQKYGCIPRFIEVGTGSFIMETYLPDSDAVSALVSDLRDRCSRVKIRSLTSTDQQNYTEPCTIDLTPLTPKQREAIDTAQQMGYYEPCSDVELGEVATELGISSSALSQRLQRGEANVIDQLSCQCDSD